MSRFSILFLFICFIIVNLAYAEVILVPDDFEWIQDAIDEAENGDTVLVAAGTYVENINFDGKNIVLGSLFLTTGEEHYIEETIIDGDEWSRVVTFNHDETSDAELVGFTIRNGYSQVGGAGIYCEGSSPTLRYLKVTNNSTVWNGGAICFAAGSNPILDNATITENPTTGLWVVDNSSPTVTNVVISDNEGGRGFACSQSSSPRLNNVTITGHQTGGGNGRGGAGISITESEAELTNIRVTDNLTGSGPGGAISIGWRSDVVITNAVISDNTSNGADGGGLGVYNYSEVELNNVVIEGNQSREGYEGAGGQGGGLSVKNSSLILTDVIIHRNATQRDVGGGMCIYQSTATLNRVSITSNSSEQLGGAMCVSHNSNTTLTNVTMSDNTAGDGGGGIFLSDNVSSELINCISWNNEPNEIEFNRDGNACALNVSYSDIEGGEGGIRPREEDELTWGNGNIDEDPLFADLENGDFHLTANSPCIDAGDPESDLDPDETRADMGAYYYHQEVDDNENVRHVPDEYETIQAAINAAEVGDSVLVTAGGGGGENGEYVENINFNGKNISLIGDPDNPSSVVIDGNEDGSVVTFENGETENAVLSGFTIQNGSGLNGFGGGIHCLDNSNPTITYCDITQNNTHNDGAGIRCYGSSPIIRYCNIFGNTTVTGHGAGIQCNEDSDPLISNCLIIDNEAGTENQERSYGGGISVHHSSDPTIMNSTISNNLSARGGGIFCADNSHPVFLNTIAWSNSQKVNNALNQVYLYDLEENEAPVSITVSYSNIHGGANGIHQAGNDEVNWGEGNINEDPLFVNTDDGDFHLTANSPCIDAGDPDEQYNDPDETRADMGAYYFHQDEPEIRFVSILDSPGNAYEVSVNDNLVYLADGECGLRIINVSNPSNPDGIGIFDTNDLAIDLTHSNNIVYLADVSSVIIIDVSDPAQPNEIATVEFTSANNVKYKDGILYVMDHDDGLGFVNIEDPENPDVVGFYELPGAGTSVAVEGNLAYVTDNENGLIIIDVSEIDNPVELGSIETSAPAIDVCVHDTIAFVAMRHAGLDIINISNPEDPIRIISVDTPGHAVSVTYNNGLVCVADGSGGLRLFDASNPNDTEEIAFYDTPGSAAGVKIRDEYVFVADAESGLLILNICDFLPRSPQISFSPESLEFSAVTLEESSDLILTISNEGDADLTVTDITTEAPFSVAFEGEFTVEPEGSVEVTVTFAPEEFGVFEGNLTITSNDPDAEETLVELSGFGLEEQDFELADGVTYTMVKIPAGSFMMGSPDDEQGRRDDESPVHEVNIPNPLWVGKYEVTQSQWQVIMGENPAENYGEGDNYPVYDINWTQIDEFENTAGNGFRLPSESEWEYFCRAGTESRFYWGDDHGYESITNYAWYQGNGENTTHPVGTLEPNWWGLFDVVGNVWEKCEDNYHNSYENAPNDGSFWIDNGDENQRKVSRGGGFPTAGEYCRSAGMRRDNYLNYDDYDEGFRLVRDLDFDIVENKILPDDGEANDLFGQEVDISGDYAIVGAFQDDDNAENSGSAYIFNRTNNGWIQQAKLNADDAEAVDYFGYDVSINGDYAIVGALNDDDNGDNSGSAYIFVRDGENWSQQAKLTASDAAAVDVFGSSVSL